MKCNLCQENEARYIMPDGKKLCQSCYEAIMWFRKQIRKKESEPQAKD